MADAQTHTWREGECSLQSPQALGDPLAPHCKLPLVLAKPSHHWLDSQCTNVVAMAIPWPFFCQGPRPTLKTPDHISSVVQLSLTHYSTASSSSPSSHPDVPDQCWKAEKVTNPPHNAPLVVKGFACTERRDEVIPGHHQHHTVTGGQCLHLAEEFKPQHGSGTPGAVGEVLTSTASVSRRKRRLTDSRASRGHSWNQSMATQLTMAGNLLLRTRSLLPTGEKHSATCRVQGRRR